MPNKVSLSRKQDNGSRYVVLRTDANMALDISAIIREYLLPPGTAPAKRFKGTDCLFLFHMDYLDKVLLTFPDAEMSTGLRRRLSRSQASELDSLPDDEILMPGFNGELWRFQAQGVHQAVKHLERHKVFMLNDEPGLGKTIQALSVILLQKRRSALVVTTKSGCGAWAKIMTNLFPRIGFEIIDGERGQRAAKANRQVRVRLVNFEALRCKAFTEGGQPWGKNMVESKSNRKVWLPDNPAIFRQRYDMIITDEFHKVKNPTAQQTQGFLQLPRAEYEMPMSGTPFLNNPLEMWPVLHRLWPTKFPDYSSFEKNVAIKKGSTIIAYNPTYMLELRTWIAAHSLRRRKDQVGIEMPEVIYSTVMVEMTGEQRRLYARIEDELITELEDGTIKNIMGALPQIGKLKQACDSPELYGGSKNSAKLTELRTIVEQLVANGEKAIIFSQFEKMCKILQREFAHYNPAYVTGKVTGYAKVDGKRITKRTVQEDKFNTDDECKLYIGTIKANQEAITLSAGTYVIMIDEEWSPNANDQAIARSAAGGLRGVNATHPVNVIRLQAEDSIEQWIDELLTAKAQIFQRVIEQDGGREIVANKVTPKDLLKVLKKSHKAAA